MYERVGIAAIPRKFAVLAVAHCPLIDSTGKNMAIAEPHQLKI